MLDRAVTDPRVRRAVGRQVPVDKRADADEQRERRRKYS